MQENNPGQLTDDEDGDDEEENDGVGPLSEVGVALYGPVDPHVEKGEERERSEAQQYQSEGCNFTPTLLLLSSFTWPSSGSRENSIYSSSTP